MTHATHLNAHKIDLGGGLIVRRLLPALDMQSIGPFIFFDHFGPIDIDPAANQDVRPHPHIGLATVTYLFEGAMMHRDSLGSVQRITPGAINWMTAGSGIVHSERTPEDLVGKRRRSHGLQLWAALPQSDEEVGASFSHTPSQDIPEIEVAGGRARVLVGTAFGLTSPVSTFSETLFLDVTLNAGAAIDLDNLPAEVAVYAVEGEMAINGESVPPFTMAVLDGGKGAHITTTTGVKFAVIGGAPLDGKRHIFWNFVSSSKERLAKAADDWEHQRYAGVPGETEWIPLPENRSFR